MRCPSRIKVDETERRQTRAEKDSLVPLAGSVALSTEAAHPSESLIHPSQPTFIHPSRSLEYREAREARDARERGALEEDVRVREARVTLDTSARNACQR